jgi:hypothetical protein
MNHFTDKPGYDAISSQPVWCFKASLPPGGHPHGAYFTTLSCAAPNLATRLRIPREKLAFWFQFTDAGDLMPLRGGRGAYIFYSPADYLVSQERRQHQGRTGL